MQPNIFWLREPQNIVKSCRDLGLSRNLRQKNYDASQSFLVYRNLWCRPILSGLHHKFLNLLRFLDKPRSLRPLRGKSSKCKRSKNLWCRLIYFLVSGSQSVGLHQRFLKFLRFLHKLRNLRCRPIFSGFGVPARWPAP